MSRKSAAVLVLLLASCARHHAAPAEVVIVDHSRPPARVKAIPLADSANAVEATYRVRPDRRFLLAVADVLELTTGKKPPSIDVDFARDHWTIAAASKPIGTLPELPAFGDAMQMLTGLAAAQHPRTTSVPGSALQSASRDIDAFNPRSLFHAMQTIGERPDARGLHIAARAAVLLILQTDDRFDFSDPLMARALALLAVARGLDPSHGGEEMAMLALEMGYDTEATALAASLPPSSVGATWVNWEKASPSSNVFRYIIALRGVRAGRPGDAPIAGDRAPTLRLFASDFKDMTADAEAAEDLVIRDLGGTPGSDKRVSRFEEAVGGRAREFASPLMPESDVASHFEARFAGGLMNEFDFAAYRLSANPATQQTLAAIGTPSRPNLQQMKQWMEIARATKFDRVTAAQARSLLTLDRISPTRRAWVLSTLMSVSAENTHPVLREFFPQFDSRPESLAAAANLASGALSDPLRYDRYFEAAARRAPRFVEGVIAGHARSVGDRAELRRIADDNNASAEDRATALQYLADLGEADDAFVIDRFDKLIEQTKCNAYGTYTQFLNRRHLWPQKERAAKRCLAIQPGLDNLSTAYYTASAANAVQHQGRYDEAWKMLEPQMPVWSEIVIQNAVTVMGRRGDRAGADELAQQMIERYPAAGSRACYATLLWREKRWSEAAALFDPKKTAYQYADFAFRVPETFVDSFENAPVSDAVAAFGPLVDENLDEFGLESIVDEAQRRGRKELAAALAMRDCENPSRSLAGGRWEGPTAQIRAWKLIREWKDADAAWAWLAPCVPPERAAGLAMFAYGVDADDLMWQLVNMTPDALTDINVQMVLAMALTRTRASQSDPRRAGLVNAVTAAGDHPDKGTPISKYLLGMIDEATLLRWGASAPDAVSLVQYSVGLKAAEHGDYDKALSWMLAPPITPPVPRRPGRGRRSSTGMPPAAPGRRSRKTA